MVFVGSKSTPWQSWASRESSWTRWTSCPSDPWTEDAWPCRPSGGRLGVFWEPLLFCCRHVIFTLFCSFNILRVCGGAVTVGKGGSEELGLPEKWWCDWEGRLGCFIMCHSGILSCVFAWKVILRVNSYHMCGSLYAYGNLSCVWKVIMRDSRGSVV